ncbi:hypothetical protein [Neochlamydia sp. AcF84]|uniref:hypothetical protein n=1 Tax=Neochlamydia sp. AcF84 TaxID=2315858 RepID=UPI00140C0071|nr:hypothetical protein [Neochlamydia sp. AcF84]
MNSVNAPSSSKTDHPSSASSETIKVSGDSNQITKSLEDYQKKQQESRAKIHEAFKNSMKPMEGAEEAKNAVLEKQISGVVDTLSQPIAKLADKVMPGTSPLVKDAFKTGSKKIIEAAKSATKFQTFPDPKKTIDYPEDSASPCSPCSPSSEATITSEELHLQINITCQELGISKEEVQLLLDSSLIQSNQVMQQLHSSLEEVHSWMKAEKQQAVQKQQLQNYNQAIDFLDQLGGMTGCKELQTAAQGAKTVFSIFTAVDQLSNLSSAALSVLGPSAVLGPVGMIGGAALAFISLFMSGGPDPTQLVLEKLGSLSEQLGDLHKSMNKQFRHVFEGQKVILDAIKEGFQQLKQQQLLLNSEVRVELGSSIQALQSSINLLFKQTSQNVQDQLLFGFTDLCSSADNALQGVVSIKAGKRIPVLMESLVNWAKAHAANPILTGEGFWNIWSNDGSLEADQRLPNHINEYLDFESAPHKLNSLIGFLAYYAVEKRNQAAESTASFNKIVNPWIWYRAIDKYLALKKMFINFDPDLDNRLLESVLNIGQNGKKMILEIQDNSVFWEILIKDYYDSLEAVKKSVLAYSQSYNQKFLKECTDEHKKRENPNLTISIIDFLYTSAQIEEFINQFTGNINHVEGSIEPCDNSGETCPPYGINAEHEELLKKGRDEKIIAKMHKVYFEKKTLSLKRIDLKDKKNIYKCVKLSSPYICAEFLRIISFRACQAKSIKGVKVSNIILVPKQGGKGWLRGNNECKNKKGSILVLDPPISAHHMNPNSDWQMAIAIHQVNQAGEQELLQTVTFKGDWNGLEGINVEAKHFGEMELDGRKPCMHKFKDHGQKEKYGNHLLDFIENYWENSDSRTITLKEEKKFYTPEKESELKDNIKKFFFLHRQRIATGLLENTGSVDQQNFEKSLQRLDMHVKLLRAFLLLTGKSVKGSPFETLINQKAIKEQLKTYSTLDPTSYANHLDSSLLPCVWGSLNESPRILDFLQVSKLSPLVLAPLHPLRLFEVGINDLQIYKVWQTLYLQEFPEYKRFNSLEEYQVKCTVLQKQLFAKESYEMFKELNAERFNDAKFKIEKYLRYFGALTAKEYKQIYLDTARWAIQKSTSKIAIGHYADDFSEVKSIDDIKNQQKILFALPRGWDCNIGYLYQYAISIGRCPIKNWQPTNFTMWADGFQNFMRLIYNDKLKEVARKAQNSKKHRLKTLKDILKVGQDLQAIIYTVCLSNRLFEGLFDHYLSILGKLITEVTTKGNYQVIERKMTTKKINDTFPSKYQQHDPAILLALKGGFTLEKLNASALILQTFLELVFASDLQDDENLKFKLRFKDKEGMYTYLAQKNKALENRLPILHLLKEYQNYVQKAKERVNVRLAYGKELLSIWYYLESNFNRRDLPCSELEIFSKLWGKVLTPEKLDLIADFLSIHPQLAKLKFCHLQFEDEICREKKNQVQTGAIQPNSELAELLKIIKNHPNIIEIQINGSKVGEETRLMLQNAEKAVSVVFTDKPESEYAINLEIQEMLRLAFASDKVKRHPLKEDLSVNSPLSFYLPLKLPFGPSLLTHLINLGSQAQRGLEYSIASKKSKNWLIEHKKEMQKALLVKPSSTFPRTRLAKKKLFNPVNLTQSVGWSDGMEGQIIDVSGFGNSCGLFALARGVKLADAVGNSKKFTEEIPPFIFDLDGKLLKNTDYHATEKIKSIDTQLREELIKAFKVSSEYKSLRQENFISCCLDYIQGYRLPIDMEAFTISNEPFLAKLKIEYLQYRLVVEQEELNEKLKEIEEIEIEIDDISVLRAKIHKKLEEGVGEITENFFSELFSQYCKNEPDQVKSYIIIYKLYAAAWVEVRHKNADFLQLLGHKGAKYLETLLTRFSSKQNAYTEKFISTLKLFGILMSTQFNSQGDKVVNAAIDIINKNITYFFVLSQIQGHWENIFENYCQYVREKAPMLSADELGCLANKWKIRLDIRMPTGEFYSNNADANERMWVKLCNPSEIHWQVYIDGFV